MEVPKQDPRVSTFYEIKKKNKKSSKLFESFPHVIVLVEQSHLPSEQTNNLKVISVQITAPPAYTGHVQRSTFQSFS